MGYVNRQPTPAEMDKIKGLIRQGMEEGAAGLSAGLYYLPNSFFDTNQMIELAKVAASYGGIYTVHMRPGPGLSGLEETIAIAKGAHIGEIFPEPTVATENYTCIMAHAPHPNAARLLVAWLMSPEGQAVINKDGFSSLPNIPGTRLLPKLLQVDPVAAGAKAKEYAGMLGLS
jgi:ABC-type glycerol-3-phosphate transport system substrate-binding protein